VKGGYHCLSRSQGTASSKNYVTEQSTWLVTCRARSEPGGTRWRTGGKWRGNWRMEWVASTLTPSPNVVNPALLKLMRTPRLPAVDWTGAPSHLNGLVRFGERRNLVSARVPSRSARAIDSDVGQREIETKGMDVHRGLSDVYHMAAASQAVTFWHGPV